MKVENNMASASFNHILDGLKMSYGLKNLLHRHEYILISDSLELRMFNGYSINKIFNWIMGELGPENTLLVELPDKNCSMRTTLPSNERYTSSAFILGMTLIASLPYKIPIENEKILHEIENEFCVSVDYSRVLKDFFIFKSVYKGLFTYNKPKALLLSCFYNPMNMAAIAAANELKIPTIEFQHGLINDSDANYNQFKELDSLTTPNHILVFGESSRAFFGGANKLINPENVISIGNMFVHYMEHEYVPPDDLLSLINTYRNQYKRIVCVSSQWTVEPQLLDFIIKAAKLDANILYIFMSRIPMNPDLKTNFPENISRVSEYNLYEVNKFSDFHATVYSTFALESPAMGIPNILIDINGLAKFHYTDLLGNTKSTRMVKTEQELVALINSWNPAPPVEIQKSHTYYCKANYPENLRNAMNRILKEPLSGSTDS